MNHVEVTPLHPRGKLDRGVSVAMRVDAHADYVCPRRRYGPVCVTRYGLAGEAALRVTAWRAKLRYALRGPAPAVLRPKSLEIRSKRLGKLKF